MNVHTFMSFTTYLTNAVCTFFYCFFNCSPIIIIRFLCVPSHPVRVISSMQSVFTPPFRGTFMATKMINNIRFEISRSTFKFSITIGTIFNNTVLFPYQTFWAFVVTGTRAKFSFIRLKTLESTITNNTSFFNCTGIIFHTVKIQNSGCELDKDYYDAACKRFKEQTK